MTVRRFTLDGTFRRKNWICTNSFTVYILYDSILTNDSTLVDGKGIGDPTEYALLEMARKVSVNDDVLRTMMLRLEEIPFDSDRKLMSTKYELHGVPTILTKGAVDVLLDRTTHIRTAEGIRDFTEADREDQPPEYGILPEWSACACICL